MECEVIDSDTYYRFIDGPKYNEHMTDDILNRNYDYFCTSAGMPFPKSEEKQKRLWVLDGWSQKESAAWLVAHQRRLDTKRTGIISGVDAGEIEDEYARKALLAYWHCGGNMRDMLEELKANFTRAKDRLRPLVDRIQPSEAELLLHSTVRGDREVDRLRTMFRIQRTTPGTGEVMDALQIVDSGYVLDGLRDKLASETLLAMYNQLRLLAERGPQGLMFERILHAMLEKKTSLQNDSLPLPIVRKVVYSEGSRTECVRELAEPGIFWIPSTGNFPSIDSALVHETTLYAFQMTVKKARRVFPDGRFREEFVGVVAQTMPITRAVVYLLHPKGDEAPDLPMGPRRRSARHPRLIEVGSQRHDIDMSCTESILQSLRTLLGRIQRHEGAPDLMREEPEQEDPRAFP
jgi:hypothetical protein